MADITVSSPASVGLEGENWLGMQLIARGTLTAALAARLGKARGGVPAGVTCQIQNQEDSSLIANGVVKTVGTAWWARIGPLNDVVDASTTYQLVANAPAPEADSSITVKQLRFTASNFYVRFNANTGTEFALQFSVNGTYMSGEGCTVECYLLNASGTVVANGTVQMNTPQIGDWTANFNLSAAQSNCSLVAELKNSQPTESAAAAWIDGVSVG